MNLYNRQYLLVLMNFISVMFILLLCCCNSWIVPAEYVGAWKTDKSKITVRTEPQWMKFIFISDSAAVSIKINSDKTVTGFIGAAEIVNGKLQKNWGFPPSVTGVAYIVACGSVGKIFSKDPLNHKQVELWLSPLNDNKNMKAELRLTEDKAMFPMAWLLFRK